MINAIIISIITIIALVLLTIVYLKLSNIKIYNASEIRTTPFEVALQESKYPKEVERYFVKDMYLSDETGKVDYVLLQNDYMSIFTRAVTIISSNKQIFLKNYDILTKPEAIKRLSVYEPVIKLAKFTVMYNKYLNNLDPDMVAAEINIYFKNFNTNFLYFISENCNTCERIHSTDVIKKAILLVTSSPTEVDKFIYYGL